MEKWQSVLEKTGLTIEKLRKKVKADIADYEDAVKYLESAKATLSEESDPEKIEDIKADIADIEKDLPELNKEIVDGINQDFSTLEKRRETAKQAFAGKGGRKPKQQTQAAPASTSATATPPANNSQQPANLEGGGGVSKNKDDDGKEKKDDKGGITVTEVIIGGVLGAAAVTLGLNYIFPDLFSNLFKRK